MAKLNVVLYWHLHQPSYCDWQTQTYQLPWTYLHAIKDYVDMAAHLEAVPDAHAVINFVPTLLEQIDDYAQQTQAFLQHGTSIRDSLLNALAHPTASRDLELRQELLATCQRAQREHMINRYPAFQARIALCEKWQDDTLAISYLDEQFFNDLLVWYHLVWLGETVRREHPVVQRLITQAEYFTADDCLVLFKVISELLTDLLPRYQRLAERGQIELTFTPYAHPIMPLLQDIYSAQQAMPEVDLSALSAYPQGEQRARWHIETGLAVFKRYFGHLPQGCWSAEGSLSDATIRLLGEYGLQWVASGENVLRHSLQNTVNPKQSPHQAYRLLETDLYGFFRDDRLSDLIGFEYAKWHGDDAVANLTHQLSEIAQQSHAPDQQVVAIILDGENAWEYYPFNGFYFLRGLYETLSHHPQLQLTTFAECINRLEQVSPAAHLSHVVAGSWVYGTFSTWIGDTDKNQGWQRLIAAKHVYDKKITQLPPAQQASAARQLAICEGSDWFWWFGDYNPSAAVQAFDRLYRQHLRDLYLILQETPPAELDQALSLGGGAPPTGGVMRTGAHPSE